MIYLDMDGVLADFDSQYERLSGQRPHPLKNWTVEAPTPDIVEWKLVHGSPDFFSTMSVLPDAMDLFRFVDELGHGTAILTGVPSSVSDAVRQKRLWAAEHFPGVQVFCCPSRDKWRYCHKDVLVDDWQKYRVAWEGAGGVFIHHKSAANSIRELRQWNEARGSLQDSFSSSSP